MSEQQQTIDVDTLVRAALDARRNWHQTSDVVDLIGSTHFDSVKGHLTRPAGVSQALRTATSAAGHLGVEG